MSVSIYKIERKSVRVKSAWLLNIISFFSAFLLFQIEFIVAKLILPDYGGSYLVWGACVVFFQAVLLLGYVFAHGLIQRLGIFRYLKLHLALLLMPLGIFPGWPLVMAAGQGDSWLAVAVFVQLLIAIGPVFFVLSTMSLALQKWLAASDLPERVNPYALYSLSNAGSFTALLSYPFVFESFFNLSTQITLWRVLYVALAVLNVLAYWTVKVAGEDRAAEVSDPGITASDVLLWLLLGAGGAIMFLAVTNIMTSEIAPVPLLWIVPLGIYLLAFVLNFKRESWCPSWIGQRISATLALAVLLYFFIQRKYFPLILELVFLNTILFNLCMYCQNQLIRHKPKNHRGLTVFYVMIALGSFLGSLLITWIVPLLATGFVEYFIGLSLIAFAGALQEKKQAIRFSDIRQVFYLIIFLAGWPVVIKRYHFVAIGLIIVVLLILFSRLCRNRRVMAWALVLLIGFAPLLDLLWFVEPSIYIKRNYYGIYKVTEADGLRKLYHGTTIHGIQFQDLAKRYWPLAYYGPESPVREVMTTSEFDFRRIGIIGLGIGVCGAFTGPEQNVDFYELDPDIYQIARKYFSYVQNTASPTRYFFGDARVSLKQQPRQAYDLLVIDAFGGDSIPVHLINKEAFELYRQQLSDHGIVLLHSTNGYFRLGPVLVKLAEAIGARICYKVAPQTNYTWVSEWVVITWDEAMYDKLVSQLRWHPADPAIGKAVRLWTDQYSNFLPIIKMSTLLDPLRSYTPFSW